MSIPKSAPAEITFRKTMTVADQGFFTGISGNLTKTHVDRTHARAAGLADMAVFELAAAALFSNALDNLAGADWRIGGIEMSFAKALPVGCTLAATARKVAGTETEMTCELVATLDDVPVITGVARMVPLMAETPNV